MRSGGTVPAGIVPGDAARAPGSAPDRQRAVRLLQRARRLGHRPPAVVGRSGSGDRQVQREVEANSFKELLEQQQELQKYASNDPTPRTTVGFEHEFAQMQTGPLRGITHADLAVSKESLDFTGLPFSLESDANDAVELVSPPFLLDTISKKVPLPDPADVGKVDTLIAERLASLTSKRQSFKDLLKAFTEDPGLHFTPEDVKVTSSNVNPGVSDVGDLQEVSNTERVVPKSDLLDIEVTYGRKSSSSGGISSQVNFATDAMTYHLAQAAPESEGYAQVNVFRGLEDQVFDILKDGRKKDEFYPWSGGLTVFLREMARRMASTLAVRSIDRVEEMKGEIFAGGHGGRQASNRYSGDNKPAKIYDLHSGLRSHVKDTKGVWLKDTLENFGLGFLTANDWRHVMRIALDQGLRGQLKDLELAKNPFKGDEAKEINENLVRARKEMLHGLTRLANHISVGNWISGKKEDVKKTMGAMAGPEKQPAFGSHDREWLGVRQDTFIPQQLLAESRPKAWKRTRLHVLETRGDSLQTLFDIEIAYRIKDTKQDDETIAEALKLRIDRLVEDAEKRLEEAKKDWPKDTAKPSRVKVLEDLVEQRKAVKMDEDRVADVRKRL